MSLTTARAVTFIMSCDRATAETWYCETLGLPRPFDDGFAAVFELSGMTLRITQIADFVPGAHPVLGWAVRDIALTARALADKGVVFTVYEGFGQDPLGIWTSPDGATKVAWFADPDGNVLSLTENTRGGDPEVG